MSCFIFYHPLIAFGPKAGDRNGAKSKWEGVLRQAGIPLGCEGRCLKAVVSTSKKWQDCTRKSLASLWKEWIGQHLWLRFTCRSRTKLESVRNSASERKKKNHEPVLKYSPKYSLSSRSPLLPVYTEYSVIYHTVLGNVSDNRHFPCNRACSIFFPFASHRYRHTLSCRIRSSQQVEKRLLHFITAGITIIQ